MPDFNSFLAVFLFYEQQQFLNAKFHKIRKKVLFSFEQKKRHIQAPLELVEKNDQNLLKIKSAVQS